MTAAGKVGSNSLRAAAGEILLPQCGGRSRFLSQTTARLGLKLADPSEHSRPPHVLRCITPHSYSRDVTLVNRSRWNVLDTASEPHFLSGWLAPTSPRQFRANIPGLRNVQSSPEETIADSIAACMPRMAFGCWNSG